MTSRAARHSHTVPFPVRSAGGKLFPPPPHFTQRQASGSPRTPSPRKARCTPPVTPSPAVYNGHQAMTKEGYVDDDVLWCPCCLRLLPSMGRGWYGCRVTAIVKLSNSWVVTRCLPPTPMDPAHTIGGRGHVRGVLGEGRVSLVRRLCPHVLRGGTSADDSRRLIIVASFFGGLWHIFYLGGLHEPRFGLRRRTRT